MKTQYPSPMEEHIRPHERIGQSNCEGEHIEINGVSKHPVILFLPKQLDHQDTVDIVFHFHGSNEIIDYAACQANRKILTVTINLGSGSSAYESPFQNIQTFGQLHEQVKKITAKHQLVARNIIISGFSAGYGAIRAIISNAIYIDIIDGVLLLDGMHTDYIPDGKTLYEGGKLNAIKLDAFLSFAQEAAQGNKKFLFTHSAIFPGTYASTTECADYLINELGLDRNYVLRQGPLGMQLLAITEQKGMRILAFAGNTAPDHMDHLHAFHAFIDHLLK